MKNSSPDGYQYLACGLDDIYLVNLPVETDRGGHGTVTIKNVNLLHQCIRYWVATRETRLNNKEIRFIRTELSLTQAELARLLHKDGQTVGRWERGDTAIDGASETLLRLMALEDAPAGLAPAVRELAARSATTTPPVPIRVDASNPQKYRLAA